MANLHAHQSSINKPLTVTLDTADPTKTVGGPSPTIEIWASTSSAPQIVTVSGSYDGTTWFDTDEFNLTAGKHGHSRLHVIANSADRTRPSRLRNFHCLPNWWA